MHSLPPNAATLPLAPSHLLPDARQPAAQRAVAHVLQHRGMAARLHHDAIEGHHKGVPQAGQLLGLAVYLGGAGILVVGQCA